MKRYTLLAVLLALTVVGCAKQASAQTVPSTQNLQAFSSQAKYMSLAGYLRWQYFKENNVWISHTEAEQLVKSQQNTTE